MHLRSHTCQYRIAKYTVNSHTKIISIDRCEFYLVKGYCVQFKDNLFFRAVTSSFVDDEKALFSKMMAALYPATSLVNIAHQLTFVLSALTSLNQLKLPKGLKYHNRDLIQLLERISHTEQFKNKLVEEQSIQGEGNPMYGHMQDYPVASLFSLSLPRNINQNTRQLFFIVCALIYWISLNKTTKKIVEMLSLQLRKFIEKQADISIKKLDLDINLEVFVEKWGLFLLKNKGETDHQSFFSHSVLKLNFLVYTQVSQFKNDTPSFTANTSSISVLIPPRKITAESNVTIQKRRYIPKLNVDDEIDEDSEVLFTDVKISVDEYIDDEALEQSFFYGSRLELNDLMQLSYRPVSLHQAELYELLELIKKAIASNDQSQIQSAALTLIVLCTSKPFSYLKSLPVGYTFENDCHDFISLASHKWHRSDIRMEGAFTAKDDQKEHLENVQHELALPLPLILIEAFEYLYQKRADPKKWISIKSLCGVEDGDNAISAQIIEFINVDKTKFFRNLTSASIRGAFFEIISKKYSMAHASLLLANTEYATNTSHYYLSQEQSTLFLAYQTTLKELGVESKQTTLPPSAHYSGSELAIQKWRTICLIKDKYNEVTKTTQNISVNSTFDELVTAHNNVVLYSVLILLITTGHRSRQEYSFSDFTIDETRRVISIADKQNFCDSSLRILPLSDIVLDNLTAYRNHCDTLSRLMSKFSPVLTQKLLQTSKSITDNNCPLFYLVGKDQNITVVGQQDILNYLIEWNLPSNAFRHYFFSFLQQTGASKIAGYFMGHIRAGEHVFSNLSNFTHCDMSKFRPSINAVADSLRCSTLYFERKAGRKIPFAEYKKDGVYIPSYLNKQRVFNKKKMRNEVRVLVEKKRINKNSFMNNIDLVKDSIILELLEEKEACSYSVREFNYKLKTLDKFIVKLIGTKNASSISHTRADAEDLDMNLQPNNLFLSNEAHKLSKYLSTWVLAKSQNEEMKKNSCNREFIKIVISLIVHGNFSFEIDSNFIAALKSPVFKDGNILWLSWHDNKAGKRRIFIDAITGQLIINNPVYLTSKIKHASELGKVLFTYLGAKIYKNTLQFSILGKKVIHVNKLIKFLNKRLFFSNSGMTQAYLNKRVSSTLLSDEVLTRWLRNEPCYKIQDEQFDNKKEFLEQKFQTPQNNRKEVNNKDALQLLATIRIKLNESFEKSGYTSTKMLVEIIHENWAKTINFKCEQSLQVLMDNSSSLSTTSIAVLCWLYNTAGRKGKGGKTIAIQTLLSYISKVAKPLIQIARDESFFELNKLERESLYIEVINSRNVSHASEAALVLRTFDNHIVDLFKLPSVSWLTIEPSIFSNYPNVRANIINQREYEAAMDHLQNDLLFNAEEKAFNCVLLIFCYRLGLRKSEAQGMMVDEIDLKNGILHVRSNRYRRLKTENSSRRLPLFLFLSPDEIFLVNQLIERTLLLHNQQINVGIFARILDSSKLIDFSPNIQAIASALKEATQDPSISLHITRHSFASYLYLITSRGKFPPSVQAELNRWCRDKCGYKNFSKKLVSNLLSEHSSNQKILHAISLLLGHGNVKTTITNYVHVLDLVCFFESERQNNQLIEIKDMKYVNGLKISNANHIVSRFDDETRQHIAISYHQLKNFVDFREVDVIREKANISLGISKPNRTQSSLYNIAVIEAILINMTELESVENISQKFHICESYVNLIAEIAGRLKEETAYDGIVVYSSNKNIKFKNNELLASKSRGYNKTVTYKKILNSLDKLSPAYRDELLLIWKSNYQRTIAGYALKTEREFNRFYEIISNLSYDLKIQALNFVLKIRSGEIRTKLFDIVDSTVGSGKNSINHKFNYAMFLFLIYCEFESKKIENN